MSIKEAKKAMQNAYAPYSKFKVGAAILLDSGEYILGSNIENASFGLSNCAERSALFSLISQGYQTSSIKEITIIGDTKNPISPCGACRQVMYELLPDDAKIILTNLKGDVKYFTKFDLLPYGFDLKEDASE